MKIGYNLFSFSLPRYAIRLFYQIMSAPPSIIKKLEFSIKYIKYLGFTISIDRIKADLEKIAIIN